MPSLLDQRPIPRRPPIFGQALVAQQRAEQEQANRAQRAGEFAVREGRMAEGQAERIRQNDEALRLREKAIAVADDVRRAQLAAANVQIEKQKAQAVAFTKAMKALGAISPNDADADMKIASILADNPAALDEVNSELSGVLKEQAVSLKKNISEYRSMAQKRDEEKEKIAQETARQQALLGVGAVPTGGTVGGINYKVPQAEEGMTFSTIDEAKSKFPGARLNFTLNEDGTIFVPKGGIPAPKQGDLATGLMGGTTPAPAAATPPAQSAESIVQNRIPIPKDAVFKRHKTTGATYAYGPDGAFIGEVSGGAK